MPKKMSGEKGGCTDISEPDEEKRGPLRRCEKRRLGCGLQELVFLR